MEVREDDEDFQNPVDLMFEALERKKPNHFAVRQYKKFKLAAGKTAKSILISCGARLAPFDIERIDGIASPDCNSPLIINAFIWSDICSYMGLLAWLLINSSNPSSSCLILYH
jgi:hypothetical protein